MQKFIFFHSYKEHGFGQKAGEHNYSWPAHPNKTITVQQHGQTDD